MTLQALAFLCPFVRRQVHMSLEDKVSEEDAAIGKVSSRGRVHSQSLLLGEVGGLVKRRWGQSTHKSTAEMICALYVMTSRCR